MSVTDTSAQFNTLKNQLTFRFRRLYSSINASSFIIYGGGGTANGYSRSLKKLVLHTK